MIRKGFKMLIEWPEGFWGPPRTDVDTDEYRHARDKAVEDVYSLRRGRLHARQPRKYCRSNVSNGGYKKPTVAYAPTDGAPQEWHKAVKLLRIMIHHKMKEIEDWLAERQG